MPQPKHTRVELIDTIPLPPEYMPLPHRQIHRHPMLQLPPHTNRDSSSLFTLFLTEAYFEIIAANTNRYAEVKEAGRAGNGAWEQTSSAEIKVFIVVFIYMGVVCLPAYEDYWSSKYGKFICANHITLNCFEDLKRYMHISDHKLKPSSKYLHSKSDNSKDV